MITLLLALLTTIPAHANSKCGKIDISGRWQIAPTSALGINQLGCDSAIMVDGEFSAIYAFVFDGKTRSTLAKEGLKFLHIGNVIEAESGSYTSSIQKDASGEFIKIQGVAKIKYHAPNGKTYTADISGDVVIASHEVHHFDATCESDTKKNALTIWAGHFKILKIYDADKKAALAALKPLERSIYRHSLHPNSSSGAVVNGSCPPGYFGISDMKTGTQTCIHGSPNQ